MKKAIILGTLLVVSCAKITEIETAPVQTKDNVKTVPYSVTICSDETRATLDEDLKTIRYAAGDRLYLESESRDDVKAVLTLKSGDERKTENVTFSGDMQYTGDKPSADLLLKATLVSSSNVGIQITDGKVTGIDYPTHNNCCTDVFDAVEKYSLLTGLGTFGERKFPLRQHTAFLSFAVNMQGIEQAGQTYSVYFMNDGQSYLMGNLNTGSADDQYRIKFALPVAEGTVLKDASVKLVKAGGYNSNHTSPTMFSASFGRNEPITLTPKVYRVTKTATAPAFVNTGLPILEIWTKGTDGNPVTVSTIDTNKDTEYPARAILHVGNENPLVLETDSEKENDDPYTNCTIKGRGNTTWNWAKKPYKLKLEKKTKLLGLGAKKSKHWVLLANFMDKTMMRNRVAMELSSMMTNLAWTPQSTPVELYIDGVHRGNYLLIEQVRVDDGRVVVKPTGATAENVNDVGFMLELDFHFDNYYGSSTSSNKNKIQWRDPHGKSKYANVPFYDYDGKGNKGIPFSVKEPDWNPDDNEILDKEEDQLTYIKNYVSQAGASLYPSGNNSSYSWWKNVADPNPDPNTGYPKYLDVDSFIDYWIVFEVMINHELGNPGSVYMTKPVGGKLTAGPCWDFDWGTLSDGYNNARTPNPTTNLMNADAIWYQSLMKDYSYVNRLYDRFMELKPQMETIPAKIDEWEREMAVSAELNFQMWNPKEAAQQQGRSTINGDETLSYHDAVARIKQFYTDRLAFVEGKLLALRNSPAPSN